MDDANARYARQIAFAALGPAGQSRLAKGSVLVVGCGGLGSAAATALVRAGVGRVRVVDPEEVELGNLHRQQLFDEGDVALRLRKAEAALAKLRRINSEIDIEVEALRLEPDNAESLVADVSLVIDGTDTLEARHAINDACFAVGKPWIYGGVADAAGMTMTLLPGRGPCFRCAFPGEVRPLTGAGGVLGPLPAIIGGIQAVEACKLLVGAEPSRCLLALDLWSQSITRLELSRDPACACCGEAAP